MKFLIVIALSVLCGLVKCEELTKENIMAAANHCQEETGATDDDVTALFNHSPAATTTEAKCLKACVMKKFGVLSNDGKLMADATIKLANALIGNEGKTSIVTEIISHCNDIPVSDDHCEAAVEYGTCLHEHATEKGLIPLEL